MTPDTRQRPGGNPGVGQIAEKAVRTQQDTSCPLACSPSCAYRCPVLLRDAALELVAELVAT